MSCFKCHEKADLYVTVNDVSQCCLACFYDLMRREAGLKKMDMFREIMNNNGRS